MRDRCGRWAGVVVGALAGVAGASAQCDHWLPVEQGWLGEPVYFNGEWLAAGSSNPAVRRWDGVRMMPADPRLARVNPVGAVEVGGKLYIGALSVDGIDGQTGLGMVVYDGVEPHVMPGLTWTGRVWCVAEHEGTLYCAGWSGPFGGRGMVSRWTGTTWEPMDPTLSGSVVMGLVVWDGRLHAVVADTLGNGGDVFVLENGAFRVPPWTGIMLSDIRGVHAVESGIVVSCAGATFPDGTATHGAVLWDGQYRPMGGGLDLNTPAPTAVLDGGLYAAGSFTQSGLDPSVKLARWDAAGWTPAGPLPAGAEGLWSGGGTLATSASGLMALQESGWRDVARRAIAGSYTSMAVLDGRLFASGDFFLGGVSLNHVARYEDGRGWSPLGLGTDGAVSVLCAHQGELYAGGVFSTAGGAAIPRLARWDGTQWRPVGLGVDGRVLSMAVYHGELVVGGLFVNAGGSPARFIARWNGSSWSSFPGLMSGGSGVTAMGVVGEDLVVTGGFRFIDGRVFECIARWDGAAWSPMGPGTGSARNAGTAVATFRGLPVVAAPIFRSAAGENVSFGLAAWDGQAWGPLGDMGHFSSGSGVRAMVERGGDLYVAGDFLSGVSVQRFDGSGWTSLLEDTLGRGRALAVRGEGLEVGGVLGTGDGVAMVGFGRLGCPPAPPTAELLTPRVTLCPTGAGELRVRAEGEGVQYQWRRAGVPIEGADGPTLTMAGDPGAVGEYDCLVFSTGGSVRVGPARVDPCIIDFTCDGFVDWADFDGFWNAFEVGLPTADLTGDGFLDFFDVIEMYDRFERGC